MWRMGLNRILNSSFSVTKRWASTDLKGILAKKIPKEQERIKNFRKAQGGVKISDVSVNAIYGGMRGVKGLICETSHLDKDEGIRIRGYTLEECMKCLPKAEGGEQPLPEGIFWLLLTGDIPDEEQTEYLSREWALRAEIPDHVCQFLVDVPKCVHPMSQLSAACTILNTESQFVKALDSGVKKAQYWESTYEDAMNLIAKVTPIAALIYKNTFKGSCEVGSIETSKDWTLNFCNMIGYKDPCFVELMRMYFILHCDHEGGNVSAHATHLVGSALSDAYLSFAAGMNGLAGPLHGLANQEVVRWIDLLKKETGEDPSEEDVKKFVWKTLKSGQVVPGYGHAVLRKTDPRYLIQREFGLKHTPDDPYFKIAGTVFKVVPGILTELGKVQNPWPNVDAASGILLQHYGLKEMSYYTVLFGVSRCLGVMANLVWDRALGLPIERPKSITTSLLIDEVAAMEGKKMKKKN